MRTSRILFATSLACFMIASAPAGTITQQLTFNINTDTLTPSGVGANLPFVPFNTSLGTLTAVQWDLSYTANVTARDGWPFPTPTSDTPSRTMDMFSFIVSSGFFFNTPETTYTGSPTTIPAFGTVIFGFTASQSLSQTLTGAPNIASFTGPSAAIGVKIVESPVSQFSNDSISGSGVGTLTYIYSTPDGGSTIALLLTAGAGLFAWRRKRAAA